MSGPSFAPRAVPVPKRFHIRELSEEECKPRSRTKFIDDAKMKNRLVNEEYMPDEPQYEVTMRAGGSLRLLKSELSYYGFDQSPYEIPVGGDEMIPDPEDMINVSLSTEAVHVPKIK